jgi:hypothetical protein
VAAPVDGIQIDLHRQAGTLRNSLHLQLFLARQSKAKAFKDLEGQVRRSVAAFKEVGALDSWEGNCKAKPRTWNYSPASKRVSNGPATAVQGSAAKALGIMGF